MLYHAQAAYVGYRRTDTVCYHCHTVRATVKFLDRESRGFSPEKEKDSELLFDGRRVSLGITQVLVMENGGNCTALNSIAKMAWGCSRAADSTCSVVV